MCVSVCVCVCVCLLSILLITETKQSTFIHYDPIYISLYGSWGRVVGGMADLEKGEGRQGGRLDGSSVMLGLLLLKWGRRERESR